MAEAEVSIKSGGLQYQQRSFLETASSEEIKSYYKHYFKYLTNLEVVNFELANNKSKSLVGGKIDHEC